MCVFLLTAFIYVCRDVDGSGVIGDQSFEVRINVEIIRNISFLLCLIALKYKDISDDLVLNEANAFVVTLNDKGSILCIYSNVTTDRWNN